MVDEEIKAGWEKWMKEKEASGFFRCYRKPTEEFPHTFTVMARQVVGEYEIWSNWFMKNEVLARFGDYVIVSTGTEGEFARTIRKRDFNEQFVIGEAPTTGAHFNG
jgi:hypothetical protein